MPLAAARQGFRAHVPPQPEMPEPVPIDPPTEPGRTPEPEIDPKPDVQPELPDTRTPDERTPQPPTEIPDRGPR